MKILSNTEHGGRVVEFSRSEFRELFILAQSLNENIEDERQAVWDLQARGLENAHIEPGIDFSGVFGAVRAFTQAKFLLNKMKVLSKEFEEHLNKYELVR